MYTYLFIHICIIYTYTYTHMKLFVAAQYRCFGRLACIYTQVYFFVIYSHTTTIIWKHSSAHNLSAFSENTYMMYRKLGLQSKLAGQICIYTCIHTHVYIYICVCIHMELVSSAQHRRLCRLVLQSRCLHMYVYTHTYTNAHTPIRTHMELLVSAQHQRFCRLIAK